MEETNVEYITIVGDDGTEDLLEILFTFNSEQFQKDYVVCAKEVIDENGEEGFEIYSFSYVEGQDGEGEIFEISNEEEQMMVEETINMYMEDFDDSEDEEE